MVSRSPLVAAIDVGSYSTKVVIARRIIKRGETTLEYELLGFGSAPTSGIRRGVVINVDRAVESISQSVAKAEKEAGVEASQAVVSISGGHLKSISSHGVVPIRSNQVKPTDIARVLESAQAVVIPHDRELLHVLPQEYVVDDQFGIKDPIGISGVRLSARVNLITVSSSSTENILRCVNRSGFNVNSIIFSSLGTASTILNDQELNHGVCLIDLGAGTTDITVFKDGSLIFAAVLPFGGNHITNDVAAGLKTNLSAAEHIKCLKGLAYYEHGQMEMLAVPTTSGNETRAVSLGTLCSVIEPRATEIMHQVQETLISAGINLDLLSGGLVLTGGTANLKGLNKIAEEVFKLPIRVSFLNNLENLVNFKGSAGETLKKNELSFYSTALGCLLFESGKGNLKNSYNRNSSSGRWLKNFTNWLAQHF
jgi:cell division protein FtsA